ncbi:hypothetical protein D3C75_901520 [compost metagenome]
MQRIPCLVACIRCHQTTKVSERFLAACGGLLVAGKCIFQYAAFQGVRGMVKDNAVSRLQSFGFHPHICQQGDQSALAVGHDIYRVIFCGLILPNSND